MNHKILAYLPFIVLAVAVLTAALHIAAYW